MSAAKPAARLSPRALSDYVKGRGYRAAPLTNSVAAAQEAAPLETTAYELLGPRRNRTVVVRGADGCYSGEEVSLWCDAVDYANDRLSKRRALARARPTRIGRML